MVPVSAAPPPMVSVMMMMAVSQRAFKCSHCERACDETPHAHAPPLYNDSGLLLLNDNRLRGPDPSDGLRRLHVHHLGSRHGHGVTCGIRNRHWAVR